MNALLKLSRLIDATTTRIGKATIWLVLIVVVISSGNALMRYAFNYSSNALLEIQWYLFGLIFMACAGYTLLRNEHVRIDLISNRFSRRGQAGSTSWASSSSSCRWRSRSWFCPGRSSSTPG